MWPSLGHVHEEAGADWQLPKWLVCQERKWLFVGLRRFCSSLTASVPSVTQCGRPAAPLAALLHNIKSARDTLFNTALNCVWLPGAAADAERRCCAAQSSTCANTPCN